MRGRVDGERLVRELTRGDARRFHVSRDVQAWVRAMTTPPKGWAYAAYWFRTDTPQNTFLPNRPLSEVVGKVTFVKQPEQPKTRIRTKLNRRASRANRCL